MISWVQCHSSAAHTGIPVCHQTFRLADRKCNRHRSSWRGGRGISCTGSRQQAERCFHCTSRNQSISKEKYRQHLVKFYMTRYCNNQQDLVVYSNFIFLILELGPHHKLSLVNLLHWCHEIPYSPAGTALLHIAFDWKWPHESGCWPLKERQSCSPAGLIFVQPCLAELCQVYLQTGCMPLERHNYDHCFA